MIFKKNIEDSHQEPNIPPKWAKQRITELNREFSTEESQKFEKHLNVQSLQSSVKWKSKGLEESILHQSEWLKIKTWSDSTSWQEYWARGTLFYCWLEYKLVEPLWKSFCQLPRKVGNILPQEPAISLLGIYRKYAPPLHQDTFSTMLIAGLFIPDINCKKTFHVADLKNG